MIDIYGYPITFNYNGRMKPLISQWNRSNFIFIYQWMFFPKLVIKKVRNNHILHGPFSSAFISVPKIERAEIHYIIMAGISRMKRNAQKALKENIFAT